MAKFFDSCHESFFGYNMMIKSAILAAHPSTQCPSFDSTPYPDVAPQLGEARQRHVIVWQRRRGNLMERFQPKRHTSSPLGIIYPGMELRTKQPLHFHGHIGESRADPRLPAPRVQAMQPRMEKKTVQRRSVGFYSSANPRKIARCIAACVEENGDWPDRAVARLSNPRSALGGQAAHQG